jgi:hypothetical protein
MDKKVIEKLKLAIKPKAGLGDVINTEYDIPYTAGYSVDGKTIYIDRKFPKKFTTTVNQEVDLHKYLTIHEVTEKAMEDKLGIHFNPAHQIALGAEQAALHEDNVLVDEYYGFLERWVTYNLELKNIKKIPPDLDMKPYIEDNLTEVIEHCKKLQGDSNGKKEDK